MKKQVYYNPSVAPTLLLPKTPPETKSQEFYYSNNMAESIKQLEKTQTKTNEDLTELKGTTHYIASQLKEFKNKAMNMLSNLMTRQNQHDTTYEHYQETTDHQLNTIKDDINQLKTTIEEQQNEKSQQIDTKLDKLSQEIQEIKTEENVTLETILESHDLQGLLLEDISKRQSAIDYSLKDDLEEIKVLINKLTSQNYEQNDIQLEYQKLHEKLLYKIIEMQVDLEEQESVL